MREPALQEAAGISRRVFAKEAAATALAVSAGPFGGGALGASEKIIVGIIGCGGMGRANMRDFMRNKDVEIAAVCDVYDTHLYQAVELANRKPTPYKDFRKLLERKDIDVVVVATPDHWHALQTIYACEAGKDVYVEKPLSLTISEGRKMVETARRTKRIVQVGTQQRSGAHFQRAVELVRSGKLGKVSFVRAWNHYNSYPEGIGNPPDTDPPPGLDWDMWLGPAPYAAYNPSRFVYNFRYFWDYSGGELTDWGTHLFDVVHWVMNVDAPLSAYAAGGKYYIQDNRETPDNLEVLYEYPGFIMNYSYRILNGRGIDGKSLGILFHGTEGALFVDRRGFEFTPEPERVGNETVLREAPIRSDGSPQHLPHVRSFLECVKSRQLPNSDIEIGHRSTSACIVGNISLRAKQKVIWDAKTEQVVGSPEANRFLRKEYRKPWKFE